MRKFLLAAALTAAIPSAACAQPAAPAPQNAGAPKLLIVISVDQFSGDLFDE